MFTDELPYIEENTFKDEDVSEYYLIVNELLKFLVKRREDGDKSPMLDLIYEFCLKFEYSLEFVGDAIRSDKYLSDLVKNDCVFYGFISKPKVTSEDILEW